MYRVIKLLGHWLSRRRPETLERMARVLAILCFDLLRLRRRLIIKNLTIAFGERWSVAQRVATGRAAWKHFFLTAMETLRAVDTDVLAETTYEGIEHISAALAQGRGAYMIAGHMGNWEVMAGAGTRFAAPTSCLVKEIGKGGANQLIDELRRKIGWTPIYRKPAGTALKQVRAALERNELVAFMLDQARPGAPLIPFFGQPAKTLTSLAAFWRKHPSPVIPVHIQRRSPTRHHVTVWPPLDFQRSGDHRDDTLANTALCNRMIEKIIQQCPEQYFWLHNRWKP